MIFEHKDHIISLEPPGSIGKAIIHFPPGRWRGVELQRVSEDHSETFGGLGTHIALSVPARYASIN
jgi:hypothetical protein